VFSSGFPLSCGYRGKTAPLHPPGNWVRYYGKPRDPAVHPHQPSGKIDNTLFPRPAVRQAAPAGSLLFTVGVLL
jgi:hypothetical protein